MVTRRSRRNTAIPTVFMERFLELEMAIENYAWQQRGWLERDEFTRQGLQRIVELARINYIKNPIILHGVNIKTYYVFGRGVNISAKNDDINAVIQAFVDDPQNQSELTSPQARKARDKELTVDGNLFFCLFVHPSTGKVRIGTLLFDEIKDVIRDKDNRKKILYYKREWTQTHIDLDTGEQKTETETRYYRDIRNTDDTRTTIGKHAIDQDCVVYHVKGSSTFSDWAFAVSEVYAAIDWARAYKKFLEDYAKIISSLARFAWRKKTSASSSAVQAMRTKLNSTFGQNAATSIENNPSALAGSVAIEGGDGETLDPIKTSGMTTAASEGKELRMMAGIAMNLPDHIASGDMAQGTLATAKSLDRPTEFTFVDRQELWVGVYQTLLSQVIYHAVAAPQGTLRAVLTLSENEYGEMYVEYPTGVSKTVLVDFPSILERDPLEMIQALIAGSTFNGQTPSIVSDVKLLCRQVLIILGFNDVDELVDTMYPDDYVRPEPLDPAIQQVTESLKDLIEALRESKSPSV